MSEEPTEGFVDPEEFAAKELKSRVPQGAKKVIEGEEARLFVILHEVKEAITEKEQGTIFQLERIATAQERTAILLEKLISTTTKPMKDVIVPELASTPRRPEVPTYVQKVQSLLPKELVEKFEFREIADAVIFYPKANIQLGTGFSDIREIVEPKLGKYIYKTDKMRSHFRIEKALIDKA